MTHPEDEMNQRHPSFVVEQYVRAIQEGVRGLSKLQEAGCPAVATEEVAVALMFELREYNRLLNEIEERLEATTKKRWPLMAAVAAE